MPIPVLLLSCPKSKGAAYPGVVALEWWGQMDEFKVSLSYKTVSQNK